MFGTYLVAVSLVLAAASGAVAQPLERESDYYVAAEQPYEYASVYTIKGAAPACPDEDDTMSFYDALEAENMDEVEYLVGVRECMFLFDGSHGDVIGATIGASRQLRVRFNYLHKYRNQYPVELYLEVYDLRGPGGRSDRLDDLFKRIMARHPRYGDRFKNAD